MRPVMIRYSGTCKRQESDDYTTRAVARSARLWYYGYHWFGGRIVVGKEERRCAYVSERVALSSEACIVVRARLHLSDHVNGCVVELLEDRVQHGNLFSRETCSDVHSRSPA